MPASRGVELIERRCGIKKAVAVVPNRHKEEKQMKTVIQFVIVMFCLFTGTTPLLAQWVQANSPKGFQIQCLAQSGTNLFAGDYQDGVFLSTDNGRSWTGVDSGLTNRNVRTLVVMGANLFAGTRGGVFISTNNGTSWRESNSGLTDTCVSVLTVSGTDLFAGTQYGGGIFLSTDNGASWKSVNSGLLKTAYDTSLYISVWAFTVSGANFFAGTDNGVYLSTDNGTSWSGVSSGLLPTGIYHYSTVRSFAAVGTVLFAETSGGSVYKSTNNGTTWAAADSGLTNSIVQSLVASGKNIFAGTYGDGVYLSTDDGTSWTAASTGFPSLTVQILAVSGTDLFAGTLTNAIWRRPLSEMVTGGAKQLR